MSPTNQKLAAGRARMRARFTQMRAARRQGILGPAEILGVALAGLTVLAVLIGYFYFLAPSQSKLKALLLERDRLQKQLRLSQDEYTRGSTAKEAAQKISESLNDFENYRLIERSDGRMLLYDDLNQLIRTNGLRNTSGPTYTTLESLGTRTAQAAATAGANSAATKWQSVYPGIAVNVTVEGPYQNIRHFVRDIEVGKQFIIINAVELERATESHSQPSEEVGKPNNALVSLRMDLAVYFQKANQATTEQAPVAH